GELKRGTKQLGFILFPQFLISLNGNSHQPARSAGFARRRKVLKLPSIISHSSSAHWHSTPEKGLAKSSPVGVQLQKPHLNPAFQLGPIPAWLGTVERLKDEFQLAAGCLPYHLIFIRPQAPRRYGPSVYSLQYLARSLDIVTCGSTCVAFGLGRVGLLVIMGCKSAGAARITGIDLNKDKFEKAVAVRATECISPKDSTKPISEALSEMTGEASLIDALASCSMNYGVGVVVGAPLSAEILTYDPVLLCAGRTWKGCVFGGWESRDDVPKLVTDFLENKFDLDQVTTHVFPFKQINEGSELLYSHQRYLFFIVL
ncbi:hypothetical protein DBR06_SOUSAS13610046, partial [Sousa chinensis]